MSKKILILVVSILALTLAACSGSQPAAQSNTGGNDQSQANSGNGQGNRFQSQLAVDTLELEGTSQAVTSAEAKQLLPLWQKVQTLSTDPNSNPSDLQTVYQQIQDDMTPDQVSAMQSMSLSQSDFQALMQKYNIQVTPGAFGNGGTSFPTLTADQRATREAQRTAQADSGNGQGFNGTPPPGGFRGGRGMNMMFLDPLITLLQQRAGG